MKAVLLKDYGSFEQLSIEDIQKPEINDNQLLVKVYATTVNHLDMKKASGTAKDKMPITLPWIPGHDFAGVVEEVGKNVPTFKKGDKVYGNSNGGSYAQYLAADIHKVLKMSDHLSFNEGSAVPHVGETAWQALFTHGQLKKGQSLLIHGAAGAVGAYAVQFAHSIGAKVLATGAAAEIDFIKSLGADEVIDYKTQDFTKEFKDVDLVLSMVGVETEKRSYEVLKKGGHLVSTTGLATADLAKERGVTAIAMVIEQSAEDLQKITDLIDAGKVKADIAAVFSLDDAVKGWKTLSGDTSVPRLGHGKIVLEVTKS